MAKTLIGRVTSDKADKTIVVTVVTRKTHSLYRKQYSESRKFMAHDEKNEATTGDKVSIVETRPLSARKRYTLKKIIEKPVLREGVAGDVEVPMREKKPIEKKRPAVEAIEAETQESKTEKPKKPARKAAKSEGDEA
jgi:small subunit ribosomal protein S17